MTRAPSEGVPQTPGGSRLDGVWQTAMVSVIGGRTEQQDRAGFWFSADGRAGLWLVADGLGGHAGGALATQAVVDVAARSWPLPESGEPKRLLEELCLAAHAEIKQRGAVAGVEPRSTLVTLYLRPAAAWWLHVGDSRLYHFRGGVLQTRTRDHSMVQAMVDRGAVREEAMGRHPGQSALVSALGGRDQPRMAHGHTLLGDRDGWVLCTDGLWEGVRVEELAAALVAQDLQQAADNLVRQAVERNGPQGDNVTVLLLRRGEG